MMHKSKCNECGSEFSSAYNMKRHFASRHTNDQCVSSGKRLTFTHLTSRSKHKCEYEGCSFSSVQLSNLKTHVQSKQLVTYIFS